MISLGLIEEVKRLIDSGITLNHQCMQGIGYKEIVEGMASGATELEMKEEIKKNTRHYAKRQVTFFKRMQNHTKLSPEDATVENVLNLIK